MSLAASALVAAWVVIGILAFGFAAVVRALQHQQAQLRRLVDDPRRVMPGDRFSVPPYVFNSPSSTGLIVLSKVGCSSCESALSGSTTG